MRIIVSSRHTTVSPELDAAVHDKVGRLARFDHDVRIARVHFNGEGRARADEREECEVILEANGERFQCRVAGPDGFAAVDQAVHKLEQQLSRSRSRRIGRARPA
jgi:ribosomal subunit interface protein